MKNQDTPRPAPVTVDSLTPFARAYVTAALWSSNDNSDPETGGDPFDRNYGPEDIAPETLARMAADCARFQSENAADLALYCEMLDRRGHTDTAEEFAGHDFWLTRNGHGAGFFDRDGVDKQTLDRLTNAADNFGNVDLYLGDDGRIYTI